MSSAIVTKVIEQLESLPEDLQRQVLTFVEALQATVQRGVPGKELLEFAGAIPAEDLCLMRQAIQDGCERVDLNEW
jgi:hypothetical protein